MSYAGVYTTVLTNGKVAPRGTGSAAQTVSDGQNWVRNVPHKDGNWASYVYIKGQRWLCDRYSVCMCVI